MNIIKIELSKLEKIENDFFKSNVNKTIYAENRENVIYFELITEETTYYANLLKCDYCRLDELFEDFVKRVFMKIKH